VGVVYGISFNESFSIRCQWEGHPLEINPEKRKKIFMICTHNAGRNCDIVNKSSENVKSSSTNYIHDEIMKYF
jgi:hypothetical protein